MANNQCEDPNPPPLAKKKRNLPGTPDPDAEVISLSPKSLLATNRFVCGICGKGFQRDQNLQLHRRGHNLPWKLKQRGNKEVRKRVYVCPEKSCVHHHPSRALGDLTGIKKHFSRKHGEKKWKCDKCAKQYAVQSDWKAHSKTCGTREYRCDCGTIFSRRDSFITHRAFCDALAEETARISAASNFHNLSSPFSTNLNNYQFAGNDLMRSNMMHHLSNPNPNPNLNPNPNPNPNPLFDKLPPLGDGLSLWLNHDPQIESMNIPMLYGDQFAASSGLSNPQQLECQLNLLYGNSKLPSSSSGELTSSVKEVDSSNSLLESSVPSLFSNQHHHQLQPVIDMSATALLQKAAQIGVTASSVPAFLRNYHELKSYSSTSSELGSNLESSISEFNPYNVNVYSTRQHQYMPSTLHKDDDLGGEITRDFLGVGAQTLCSSTMNGWI